MALCSDPSRSFCRKFNPATHCTPLRPFGTLAEVPIISPLFSFFVTEKTSSASNSKFSLCFLGHGCTRVYAPSRLILVHTSLDSCFLAGNHASDILSLGALLLKDGALSGSMGFCPQGTFQHPNIEIFL